MSTVDDNWLTFIVFGGIAFDSCSECFFSSPVRCLKTTRAYTRNKNWNCGVAASNQNPQGISRRQRTVRRWRIAHILAQLFAAQKAKSILFHFYWRAVCYLRQMEIDFCVRISHLSSHRRQTECERWRCRHYVDCLINLSVASFSWLHKNRLLIQNKGDNIAIWNEKKELTCSWLQCESKKKNIKMKGTAWIIINLKGGKWKTHSHLVPRMHTPYVQLFVRHFVNDPLSAEKKAYHFNALAKKSDKNVRIIFGFVYCLVKIEISALMQTHVALGFLIPSDALLGSSLQ